MHITLTPGRIFGTTIVVLSGSMVHGFIEASLCSRWGRIRISVSHAVLAEAVSLKSLNSTSPATLRLPEFSDRTPTLHLRHSACLPIR